MLPSSGKKNITKARCSKGQKAARKKKTETSLPKRPLTAYNMFFADLRRRLLSRGEPKLGFTELVRHVASQWKQLVPEQKEVFEQKATADRERYERELEQWEFMRSAVVERQQQQRQQEQAFIVSPSSSPFQEKAFAVDTTRKSIHEISLRTPIPSHHSSEDPLLPYNSGDTAFTSRVFLNLSRALDIHEECINDTRTSSTVSDAAEHLPPYSESHPLYVATERALDETETLLSQIEEDNNVMQI